MPLYPVSNYLASQPLLPNSLFTLPVNSNAMPPRPNGETPFLVVLSARALGSLGFGLSILAIWIGWLLPTTLAVLPEPLKALPVDKERRRSSPASVPLSPPPPSRRVSAPNTLLPILSSGPGDASRSRHVYFIDSERPHTARRNTAPVDRSHVHLASPENSSLFIGSTFTTSPRSSTSTLVATSTPSTPPATNACPDIVEEPITESDSSRPSSRASLCRPSRIPNMKSVFSGKGKRNSGGENDLTCTDSPPKPIKRTWSLSRNRNGLDITVTEPLATKTPSPSRSVFNRCRPTRAPPSPSPSVAPLPSVTLVPTPTTASFFNRKTERRKSNPVRRTLPYEAPYFASPPLILEEYIKALPQFEEEPKSVPERASASDDNISTSPRGRGRQPSNDKTLGSPAPQRPIPKRRSASAGWVERSASQLS
ncbi:hypothetical protein BDQ12DRAFT_677306 [Crucibulum laeve]|uniref:Uncharacterized protein n=1 Tax=Crucibulum laeve TaxID=68775 RepID=A0A5C3M9C2_9AGAR|nr:hypothetical protein BDQ12DRAFT_677306 [Crucibulum laeve]